MTKTKTFPRECIQLTAKQSRELEALTRSRESSRRESVRARILLLSAERWDTKSIAVATGSSTSTVGRIRRRYREEGLPSALRERPRPGGERKLTPEQEQRIVALACTTPPKGFARWSVRLLTSEVIRKRLVPPVGRESIRLVLHEHGIKPWREKNVVYPGAQ